MSKADKNRRGTEMIALYEILARNKRLIAKLLRRFTFSHTDLEDIHQETILRALEIREKAEIKYPRQLLIGIAKNVAREELRKRASKTARIIEGYVLETHLSNEPSADEVLEGKEKLRLFSAAVANLPPQCRKVFVLKYVYGASHKDIAGQLGLSVSTVEKHVAHGLKSCRQHMLSRLTPGGTNEVRFMFDTDIAGRKRS